MSGAVVIARQNRYIQQFTTANATTSERAASLEQLGVRDSWIFRRMTAAGVFVPADGGKFYLDEAAADEFIERRRQKILNVVGVLILAAALVYYFSR